MGKDYSNYAIRCFKDEAQAILDLIPQLTDDFNKAVEMIYECRGKVIVMGVGKSGHIGEKIAATLASTGTPSFFINPLDAYHGDLGMITASDVVIAISNSGYTDELLRLIPFIRQHNIPLIAISGNDESLLAKNSSCHLNVKVNYEACPMNLAPTSSTTATLAMGDAIACALIRVRNFKAENFVEFHPGGSLGKKLLTKVGDVVKKDELPILRGNMTLVNAMVIISDGKMGLAIVLNANKILGLVTSGDIRRAFQKYGKDSFDLSVNSIMTKNPKFIYDDMSIIDAESIFKETKVQTLIVKKRNGDFVGFLDYTNCSI